MSVKRFTPENIKELGQNEVFVFGSNIQGEHVGGAAAFAHKVLGAEMGGGFGFAIWVAELMLSPLAIVFGLVNTAELQGHLRM